jgi:Sigma-70, region 4
LITEAAVWRVAVIAAGEMAGSSMTEDPAPVKPQTLPAGCIAIPLQALAAWTVAERGTVVVGDLMALGPDVTALPADIAREWELTPKLDLRWLAGGPSAVPQLPPGLLDDLLNEVDERRQEILSRRTFAPQPETLDTLAADFGVSRGRVGQLEESARVKIAIAVCGASYAPVRWRAYTLANTGGAESDPWTLPAAAPWARPLLRWLASRESKDLR